MGAVAVSLVASGAARCCVCCRSSCVTYADENVGKVAEFVVYVADVNDVEVYVVVDVVVCKSIEFCKFPVFVSLRCVCSASVSTVVSLSVHRSPPAVLSEAASFGLSLSLPITVNARSLSSGSAVSAGVSTVSVVLVMCGCVPDATSVSTVVSRALISS